MAFQKKYTLTGKLTSKKLPLKLFKLAEVSSNIHEFSLLAVPQQAKILHRTPAVVILPKLQKYRVVKWLVNEESKSM